MGAQEQGLRGALVDMRTQLAKEYLPKGCMLAPQALLATAVLERIVNLAHDRKISTLEALRQQITWRFMDSHGTNILSLVNQYFPPIATSPFTTEPLQRLHPNQPAPPKAKKQVKCALCGQLGHNKRTCHVATATPSSNDQENLAP